MTSEQRATAHTGSPSASPTIPAELISRKPTAIRSGLRGRIRSAISPPTTNPTAPAALMNPQAAAPPSSSSAITGPSTAQPIPKRHVSEARRRDDRPQPCARPELGPAVTQFVQEPRTRRGWLRESHRADERPPSEIGDPSQASAQPGPTAATSRPPSIAPSTLVADWVRRSRALADWRSAAGTVCGVIPDDAGAKNARAVPRTTLSAARCQISARPVRTSVAVANWASPRRRRPRPSRDGAATGRRRRHRRAGRTAVGSCRPRGRGRGRRPILRSRAPRTRRDARDGAAGEEVRRPANSSRNSRWRSGATASLTGSFARVVSGGTARDRGSSASTGRSARRAHRRRRRRSRRPWLRRRTRLRSPGLDARRPGRDRRAQCAEVMVDVVEDAEVDQREPFGCQSLGRVDRPLPGLEIDLGWGKRREDEAPGRDADTRRVTREERAVRREVGDVMRRVTRASGTRRARGLAPDDVDVAGGNRRQRRPRGCRMRHRRGAARSPRAVSDRPGAARRSPRRAPADRGGVRPARRRPLRDRGGCGRAGGAGRR